MPGTSYSTASLRVPARQDLPFLTSATIPNRSPAAASRASATTCQCCGKARGYVYTGSPYSATSCRPAASPLVHSRRAARPRYEASFSDDYPLLDAASPRISSPKSASARPATPLAAGALAGCCEDACAFRGDAGREKSGNAGSRGPGAALRRVRLAG
ncbi:CbrC family protein [Pseudomonas aeruginosa]